MNSEVHLVRPSLQIIRESLKFERAAFRVQALACFPAAFRVQALACFPGLCLMRWEPGARKAHAHNSRSAFAAGAASGSPQLVYSARKLGDSRPRLASIPLSGELSDLPLS